MEAERRRLAEKRCKNEACKIQSCLQANNYKESACVLEVASFLECCEGLPADIRKYSVYCSGAKRKETEKEKV